jgi:hypothetical protein
VAFEAASGAVGRSVGTKKNARSPSAPRPATVRRALLGNVIQFLVLLERRASQKPCAAIVTEW